MGSNLSGPTESSLQASRAAGLTQSELELAEALAYIPTIDVQPKKARVLIPQEQLEKISKGTSTDKGREMIVQHLHRFLFCNASDWRPVYAAIVIASQAMLKGSPILLQDFQEGRHFDPLQRLELLQTYESNKDDGNSRAAVLLIRQKARELRDELVKRRQIESPSVSDNLAGKDNHSCTPGLAERCKEAVQAPHNIERSLSEIEVGQALVYIPTIDVQPKNARVKIPQEHLGKISRGTFTDKGREMIMQHLQSFLQSNASDWRPVYAAVVIASEALLKGSPKLMQERYYVKERHFDPLEQLELLENYNCDADDANARAAVPLIRQKARELREELVLRYSPDCDNQARKNRRSKTEPTKFGNATIFDSCDDESTIKTKQTKFGKSGTDGAIEAGKESLQIAGIQVEVPSASGDPPLLTLDDPKDPFV